MITAKNRQLSRFSIVFRLWIFMMLLILVAITFMWVAQIVLFEQNYIDAAVSQVESKLKPLAEELKTSELSNNTNLIVAASKTVTGKTILFDTQGNIIKAYSNSLPIDSEVLTAYVQFILTEPKYRVVLEGTEYQNLIRLGEDNLYYEIAIPVTWQGKRAILFLKQPIEEVYRLQAINRNQLITLSVILTFVSGLLAWFLSKQFTKPIHVIKSAVERLAEGDLKAKPDLNRKDELGQLSDSVAGLSQALQRIDVLRKEVIANVSHELSSPLSLIIGYSEMVRDVTWQNNEERNDNLNLIIREAQRMSTMVDDIMDYSQFQAGYIKLHKFDCNLYTIIESEVDFGKKSAKNFGITVVLKYEQDDIPVFLDAVKISQVIRNLLNNAINHTKDNETIFVSIDIKDGIKVTVSNPGKPIPEDKINAIWERYYSSQHQGTRRQGTGIGLSIVSTLLDAHGFTYGIECKNGFNHFWFCIGI